MANEDEIERFGWDNEEGLIFDRTKPFGDSTPEKGPLYEEVTTFDLIEIANELAAALREARKDTKRIGELERVNALHEGICNELHALHTIDDDGRFCEGCEDFWPCRTMKVFVSHDAAMKPPGGEG